MAGASLTGTLSSMQCSPRCIHLPRHVTHATMCKCTHAPTGTTRKACLQAKYNAGTENPEQAAVFSVGIYTRTYGRDNNAVLEYNHCLYVQGQVTA
jgi:hypothetical protein